MNTLYYLKRFFTYLYFDTIDNQVINIEKIIVNRAVEATLYDINKKYDGKLKLYSEDELIRYILIDTTAEALFLYRLEREIFLKDPIHPILPFLANLMKKNTGCEIYYSTKIDRGFNIQHGAGIVIGPRFEIGENFIIHQNVTLGQKNLNMPNEKIVIGNNVTIFAGAILLGNIKIGHNASVGANSVVLNNIEDNAIYAGVPAKKIK